MSPKPTLGYWAARGLGEPIRMLFHHVGVDFEDKQYEMDEEGIKQYFADKPTLGLDFPNSPYYIDGDFKLTQSLAILRYLADKHGLLGKTAEERAKVSMLEQQLMDFRNGMSRVGYDAELFESRKDGFLKGLPDTVALLAKFLGDKQFAIGSELTYVDFLFYEKLVLIRAIFTEAYQPHAALFDAYVKRIESLPTLAKYLQSRKPVRFNGASCKWNAEY